MREVPFEAKRRYYFVEVVSILWQKLQIDSGIYGVPLEEWMCFGYCYSE